MTYLKPLATIGLLAALATGCGDGQKPNSWSNVGEAQIPYKKTALPLNNFQPHFCTPTVNGNEVTVDFVLADMEDQWGGLVYAVTEDLNLYRFLEMDASPTSVSTRPSRTRAVC